MASHIQNFRLMVDICAAKNVNPEVLTRPKEFQDQLSTTQRICIVRELHKQGMATKDIVRLCPLTPRAIRWMCK